MNPETQQQLPKINFSDLVVGTPKWTAVRTEVMNALHVYGTFEALYDPLNPKLREQVFKKSLTELFGLPTHVKSRSATYSNNSASYTNNSASNTNKPVVPTGQSFTLFHGNIESIQSFTTLMWPQGNTHFCDVMQRYAEAMKELNQMVTRMILESLGVDKYYDEMNQNTKHLLGIMYYKSEQEDTDDQYMAEHNDLLFVTIIEQDEVDGLEVLIKSGQWIRPSPYSYTVLVGDSIQAWTNGRFQSTCHRVIKNKSNNTRYATLSMSTGVKGFIIQAPPELIDAAHPALYKPFEYDDYFQFYAKRDSKIGKLLEIFCGIENHV